MKKLWQKITNWELWPFYLIYVPIIPVWVWYFIRTGRVWYFSTVNPTLQFSGFEGETKREMFEQLPSYCYPKTVYITAKQDFNKTLQQMEEAGIQFPVAVKPDIGSQGLCFRKIDNEAQLKAYHSYLPVDYLIQDMIETPVEMSVFYVRYPNETKGKVTGLIAKEYMHVKGDGSKTLLQLMGEHEKAKHRLEELTKKHEENLQKVITKDEVYFLSITGNHNRGAKFSNLHNEIDEQLTAVFDALSNHAKHFYYGRFDIKTTSLTDLKQGKNFSVLEFNGTGAEPNHIYDCGMSYFKALKTLATHWRYMYEIGKINHKKGYQYASFKEGKKYLQDAFAMYARLREYDLHC